MATDVQARPEHPPIVEQGLQYLREQFTQAPEMCRKGWRVGADADEFLDKVGGY